MTESRGNVLCNTYRDMIRPITTEGYIHAIINLTSFLKMTI